MEGGLAEVAIERLSSAWACAVKPVRMHVDHQERAVVEVRAGHDLRVIKVDTSASRFKTEVHMLGAAAAGGVPVPRVLLADATLPSVLVLTRVGGVGLNDGNVSAWTDAGRVIKRIHRLPVALQPFEPAMSWRQAMFSWIDEAITTGVTGEELTPAAVEWLRDALRQRALNTDAPLDCPLHGDCQPDHFLLEGDRVAGVIDFGDACSGDPAWDLAVLTLWQPERLIDVLAGYAPDPVTRTRLRRIVPVYRTLRHLGAARWQRQHGYDPTPDLAALRQIVSNAGGPLSL